MPNNNMPIIPGPRERLAIQRRERRKAQNPPAQEITTSSRLDPCLGTEAFQKKMSEAIRMCPIAFRVPVPFFSLDGESPDYLTAAGDTSSTSPLFVMDEVEISAAVGQPIQPASPGKISPFPKRMFSQSGVGDTPPLAVPPKKLP